MVVLASAVINKSGKALVSRQFIEMSRIRIEGFLAAFPKLVGTGKQHTYVETDNVRYVYQPIESLYLLVITNKQSNILEDLETVRLLSKLVPEYSPSLDDEGICKAAFELIFAFDEVISLGHKENVTVAQVKQYCEMDSHEERLHKLVLQSKINETKDIMKRKASEIDKSKIEKGKHDKGGFGSSQVVSSSKIDSSFSYTSNSGGGGGSGFGILSENDSSIKQKGRSSVPSATAPIGLGMQLAKSQRTTQFIKALKAEGEVIIGDVHQYGQRRPSALPPTDNVTFTVEEKLHVTLRRDGGVSGFDVQGTLSMQILNEDDAHIQVQVETGNNSMIQYKTHPNMNKELYSNENILGLKDPNRPFPSGLAGDGVGLLKWRMQTFEESVVPLSFTCWPSVSGNETYFNIGYDASSTFDLRNVVISVPLPALREAPNVRQIDGEWRYDSRSSKFEWSILLIDDSNRSGSLEFVVPAADSSVFFPISVQFTAPATFSHLKVVNILPMKGGSAPKYSQRTQLLAENYCVV